MISYDAFMIATNALLAVDEDATLNNLRSQFLSEVAAYEVAIGTITLNDAGDWKDGTYYFWSFIQQSDEYLWQHTLIYSNGQIVTTGNGGMFSSKGLRSRKRILR